MEKLKQLQALPSTVLPFVTAKLPILPFLNPQIAADMWPISAIFAFVGCCLIYNLTVTPHVATSALFAAILGFLLAAISVLVIVLVYVGVLYGADPTWQDLSVRIAFFALFAGLACPAGWAAAKMLN